MFYKLLRTFKAGAQSFARNGWLSLATVSVIVITLFIVNVQVAIVFANDMFLKEVEDKVNISVYVNLDIEENEIMKIKSDIESFAQVKSVEYISSKQALADFRERNKDNETIQKSLEELGSNPLGAVLNVKAHNPDQYEQVANMIGQAEYANMISKVNYQKYSAIIDNLNKEIKSNQRMAVALGLTLSFIAILITFNSIRITMYGHKQEIEIMKLIGASNNYIRMPFVWEGIFYGLVAALISLPLIYFYLNFIGNEEVSNSILPFSNARFIKTFLVDYFMKNIIFVTVFQIVFGVLLGVVSSILAIRKHIKT